jgi:hypothetical protein
LLCDWRPRLVLTLPTLLNSPPLWSLWLRYGAIGSDEDVRRERGQCRRVSANVVGGPASIDPHVATVGPAQLLQALQERGDAGL